MRTLLLFLLIPLVAMTAVGQDADEWWQGKPIEDITFNGLISVSENELEGIVRPFVGKEFSNSLFWDLQSKLFALDYFDEFFPNALPANDEKTAVIIEFQVVERPILDEVLIEGNRFVRKLDILDTILLKGGDMVNRTKVRLDAKAVEDLYLERGFPDVTVDWNIDRDETTNLALVTFTVDEGAQSKVSEILFSGNTFASENTLKRVMTTKAQSLFSSGVFQESKLAEDILALENYYHDRGYVDAKVADVTREVVKDETGEKNQIIITFYIEEGVQFTFEGISFDGNTLYTEEELQELVRQVPGKVLSTSKLSADFARIQDIYANDGYIFNIITMEEERNTANRSIGYVVSIVEYSRAHIGSIVLAGNEKTKDYVVLRELPFEVGDVFSKQRFIEGLRNLYNLQYFSTILPEPQTSDIEGLMDIVISLEEGRTTDIQFGVTFSGQGGNFPIIGFLKWTDNNFMGKGQEFSIGTELSGEKQSFSIGFTDRWLMGRRWTGGADFTFDHSLITDIQQDIMTPIFSADDPDRVPDPYDGHYVYADTGDDFEGTPPQSQIDDGTLITDYAYALMQNEVINPLYLMDYDSYDFSLGLNTGYTWHLPFGRVGAGTGLRFALSNIQYNPVVNRPFNESVRNGLDAWLWINKYWLSVSLDTRDIIYNPSSGFYLNQRATYSGGILGGERDYISTSSKAETFFKLWDVPAGDAWNFKGILALHSSLTFILTQFGGELNTTTQDLLYLDGMSIARGWPRVYDGRALWNNWIELRMPVLEQYLWGDLFFSGVGFWPDTESFSSMDWEDYRFTFGGGVRLTVPGFPIGMYLTKRFRVDNGVVEWQDGNVFKRDGVAGSGLDFVIAFTGDF